MLFQGRLQQSLLAFVGKLTGYEKVRPAENDLDQSKTWNLRDPAVRQSEEKDVKEKKKIYARRVSGK